jgi:hypothetical protein
MARDGLQTLLRCNCVDIGFAPTDNKSGFQRGNLIAVAGNNSTRHHVEVKGRNRRLSIYGFENQGVCRDIASLTVQGSGDVVSNVDWFFRLPRVLWPTSERVPCPLFECSARQFRTFTCSHLEQCTGVSTRMHHSPSATGIESCEIEASEIQRRAEHGHEGAGKVSN